MPPVFWAVIRDRRGEGNRLERRAALALPVPVVESMRRHLRHALLDRLQPVIDSGDLRPLGETEGSHVYHQHVVRAARRDALRDKLKTAEIGTAIYYPEALHTQPCFADLSPPPLPVAEAACKEVLALPCFPGLTESELDHVAATIREFYGR